MGPFDYFSSFFKSKSKTVEELIRDGTLMSVRLFQNEGSAPNSAWTQCNRDKWPPWSAKLERRE